MKFFALAATIASVSAVMLRDDNVLAQSQAKVLPDNYQADPLWDFDNKHYANNKVDSLFPDHQPIPNKATVWDLVPAAAPPVAIHTNNQPENNVWVGDRGTETTTNTLGND